VGPFAGFLASGIKRAYDIKDFGNVFPGHGGWVDRFDCQAFSVVFVYAMLSQFIMRQEMQVDTAFQIYANELNSNEQYYIKQILLDLQ
jgi:phosphatidate cytidylyltransferase